ncbi:MAG TPA: hypothetical protein VMK84_07930 [Streptosporangiaceae bacterium]|nr:hypothetical protein [Streptosporangiaceae bacterium]
MTILNRLTLAQPSGDVSGPCYDRRQVRTGIVHIGVGNFHRAHQAAYIDTLMNHGTAMDWGICGIGLLPADARMRDVMAAQDHLYTLVLRSSDGSWDARIVGSITDFLFAPDDPEAAIEKLAAPATRIVSLTITEGGNNLAPVTGEFSSSAPQVAADLAPRAAPGTVFGLVTEALARRRERGIPAFTRPCRRSRAPTWASTRISSSRGSPTPKSATRSPGCAPARPPVTDALADLSPVGRRQLGLQAW